MGTDVTKLLQAIVDQLTMIVPVAGALAIAWIGRRIRMIALVKDAAVEAEREVGPGKGAEKHARVREDLSRTFTGKTFSMEDIDKLIQTRGRAAAHEYRDSQAPPEPK